MCRSVFLVRWHPSATTCCNGSNTFWTCLKKDPSAPQKQNFESQIRLTVIQKVWCKKCVIPSAATCSMNTKIPPGLSTRLISERKRIHGNYQLCFSIVSTSGNLYLPWCYGNEISCGFIQITALKWIDTSRNNYHWVFEWHLRQSIEQVLQRLHPQSHHLMV